MLVDDKPTIAQHWLNISCFLIYSPAFSMMVNGVDNLRAVVLSFTCDRPDICGGWCIWWLGNKSVVSAAFWSGRYHPLSSSKDFAQISGRYLTCVERERCHINYLLPQNVPSSWLWLVTTILSSGFGSRSRRFERNKKCFLPIHVWKSVLWGASVTER